MRALIFGSIFLILSDCAIAGKIYCRELKNGNSSGKAIHQIDKINLTIDYDLENQEAQLLGVLEIKKSPFYNKGEEISEFNYFNDTTKVTYRLSSIKIESIESGYPFVCGEIRGPCKVKNIFKHDLISDETTYEVTKKYSSWPWGKSETKFSLKMKCHHFK